MDPTILIAILAAAAVLLITYGVAARPSEDAVQARLSQLVVQPKSLEEMEMQLGVALHPALNNLVRRVASEDLELMVTAIQIQSQVGGNLATVLDAIAHTIRERIRIMGEIQTLTAMQRYSGYVITLLPVGLAGLLFLISPTYISVMLEKPPELFGLPMGVVFFIIGLISMGIGYLFIRRIVDIKV